MSADYRFRKIDGLTGTLKVLLALGGLMAVISLASSFMQAELLSRLDYSEAEADSNDAREQIIGLISFANNLLTAVIFACWIVRANRNVRALGARGLRFTPGWAVGYFFIPIANLFRPYQAMKDLWQASDNPANWQTATTSPILPAWWTVWILSNLVGQASFRVKLAAKSLEEFRFSTYLDIVSSALEILLCVVAFSLVSHIANAQNRALEPSSESDEAYAQ